MKEPLLSTTTDSLIPVPEIPEDQLTRIVEYASKISPLTNKDRTIYSFLAASTTISPIAYFRPAFDDTPYGLPDWDVFRYFQVAGTWIPTTSLFFLSCIDFLARRSGNIVPEELKDILKGLSLKEMVKQDWLIAIISFLSAIPLSTPLVKYPLISSDNAILNIIGNLFLVFFILAANTVAHLQPLQIILNNPYYGAPITLVNFLREKYNLRQLSVSEKQEKQRLAQLATADTQARIRLTSMLAAKKEQLINSCFILTRTGYKVELNDDFKYISLIENKFLIKELIQYKQDTSNVQQKQRNPHAQLIYDSFITTVGQLAALLVLGESFGYLANTSMVLAEATESEPAGIALAIIPMITFSVLVHNAGRVLAQVNLDFLINFMRGERTLSWPVKYCSKLFFTTFMPVILWLAYETPGSANTMIRTVFDDETSDKYINVFRWGYVGLTLFVMIDMVEYIINKSAKYYGSDDIKKIVQFSDKIDRLNSLLMQWKNPSSPDSIIQEVLFPPTPPKTEPKISTRHSLTAPRIPEHKSLPKTKRSSCCNWFSFRSTDQTEVTPLLTASPMKNMASNSRSPTKSTPSCWERLCCWRSRPKHAETSTFSVVENPTDVYST